MRLRTHFPTWTTAFLLALGLEGCGSTESDGSGKSFPCTNPTQLVAGTDTGYEYCESGFMHRSAAIECPSSVPRPAYTCPVTGGVGGCTTDADCGSGKLCASYDSEPSCGPTIFACLTGADQCAGYKDCPAGQACTVKGGHRACVQASCAIGRPFLVLGSERLAEPMTRADWCGAPCVDVSAVGPELAARLAQRWTEVGLMEHASVAAFARFALQLLSLGAPPELVALAHRAMGDETEHARTCFGLASAYAGRPVGPGPLRIDGALGADQDMESVLRLTVREGCIGETVAAIEAEEASAHTSDPKLGAVLAGIAGDERRHAELAWRFARWALTQADGALDHVIEEELAVARHEARGMRPAPDRLGEALRAHGVLDEPLRAELRRQALDQVVGPCARALLRAEQRAAA